MGRVGFVGIGLMGSRMAGRLLAAGHEVTVYNRTAAKTAQLVEFGAKLAATPAEAAAGKDVCFTIVADGPAFKTVTLGPDGILSAGPLPKLLVDMATIAPTESEEVALVAEPLGVGFLRAPVSGSTVAAEAGKLTIVASGEKTVFDAAEPYLASLGEVRYYVGTGERARYLKLIHQIMVATTMRIFAEGLVLGEKAGLDWDQMLEFLSNSAMGSPYVRFKSAPLAARDFDPAFRMDMMVKDLDLALGAGRSANIELPTTQAVRAGYVEAMAAGLGQRDVSAIVLDLEKKAGLDPREV